MMREANYAKRSMEEFMVTVHAQMRLASSLDTLTYATNIFLTLSTAILGVVLWQNGQVGVGAVAAATAMALRCKWSFSLDYVGISSFI